MTIPSSCSFRPLYGIPASLRVPGVPLQLHNAAFLLPPSAAYIFTLRLRGSIEIPQKRFDGRKSDFFHILSFSAPGHFHYSHLKLCILCSDIAKTARINISYVNL